MGSRGWGQQGLSAELYTSRTESSKASRAHQVASLCTALDGVPLRPQRGTAYGCPCGSAVLTSQGFLLKVRTADTVDFPGDTGLRPVLGVPS